MERIKKIIKNKINEIENDKEIDINISFDKGYLEGLKYTLDIIEEMKNEKLYFDIEENKIINEEKIKSLYLEIECQDIINNSIDYLTNFLDINYQTDKIKKIKNQDIKEIINILKNCWNIEILEINF